MSLKGKKLIGTSYMQVQNFVAQMVGPTVLVRQVNATEHCPTRSGEVLDVVRTELGEESRKVHVLSDSNNPGANSFCCMQECLHDGSTRIITFISNKYSKDKRQVKTKRNINKAIPTCLQVKYQQTRKC